MKLNRRDFLKGLGATALAIIASPKALAKLISQECVVGVDKGNELGSQTVVQEWEAMSSWHSPGCRCMSKLFPCPITVSQTPIDDHPFGNYNFNVYAYHRVLTDAELDFRRYDASGRRYVDPRCWNPRTVTFEIERNT